MTELVTVLVPLLTQPLTPLETFALRRCQAHLGDFPITFLRSEDRLIPDEIRAICPNADSVSFDPRYFANRTGYTKLLLSEALYDQFSWSRYLLILEPTVSVSRNELAYWCRQGYDYIQSFPEHDLPAALWKSLSRRFDPGGYLKTESGKVSIFERGNGVSLRRVKACEKLVKGRKRLINQFFQDHPDPLNDSLFWEYYLNRYRPELITPNVLARRHFAQNQASLKSISTKTPPPFTVTALDYIPIQDRY